MNAISLDLLTDCEPTHALILIPVIQQLQDQIMLTWEQLCTLTSCTMKIRRIWISKAKVSPFLHFQVSNNLYFWVTYKVNL
eukprot:13964016-Ditylum_brightwellii.AAC.1